MIILHVLNRTIKTDGALQWHILYTTDKNELADFEAWMDQDVCESVIEHQIDCGYEEPFYTVEHVGPRIKKSGTDTVFRMVRWCGFNDRTMLPERKLRQMKISPELFSDYAYRPSRM